MREPVSTTTSLAGSFLIAHPSLGDSNFSRSVIMLPDHDAKDGSMGLILNRPTGKLVGELLRDKAPPQLARTPVLRGGPVQPDQLLFAAFRWHPARRVLECRHHISVEEAVVLSSAQHHTVRAFIGYSGWTGGQLEAELAQRAWLVRKADSEQVLELERSPGIWRELTSGFGPWFKMVAEAPEEPGLN